MSYLPNDFPKLPQRVGHHTLPNFVNAKVIEPNVKPPASIHHEFDFSIKKSAAFGAKAGKEFDEGATWFPLKLVHFTCSDHGVGSYQGHYGKGLTSLYGSPHNRNHKLAISKNEYIKGISGTYTDRVTSLRVHTTKTTHKLGVESGQSFKFEVPKDHHVVGFHGRADDHLRAIGVSYSRRLASVATESRPEAESDNDQPDIEPIYSNLCIDDATRVQWAGRNMAAIQKKRNQAKADLLPIYQNIASNGVDAWVLVESEGQQYYLSYTDSATMWVYVEDKPAKDPNGELKNCVISFGSYSVNSNILGISGYNWYNIPKSAPAATIALAFVNFQQSLVIDGVTWDIEYAATQLTGAVAATGLLGLAKLIPKSVLEAGGLVIAGLVAIAAFFAVLAFASVIFKQYLLTVTVFNFDPSFAWNSTAWYSDNADLVNQEWENQTIPPFVSAGTGLAPPGFAPIAGLKCVVNYMSVVLRNESQFLQGLGTAVAFSRGDNTNGLAIKYVVHRFKSNQIGLSSITGDPEGYDLETFYKDDANWVTANSTLVRQKGFTISGYTPFLDGAPDSQYEYLVSVGLPPVAED